MNEPKNWGKFLRDSGSFAIAWSLQRTRRRVHAAAHACR
jgi:hypothetical protein